MAPEIHVLPCVRKIERHGPISRSAPGSEGYNYSESQGSFIRHFRGGFFPARADPGMSLNVVAAEVDGALSFCFFGFLVSRLPRRCSLAIAVSCQIQLLNHRCQSVSTIFATGISRRLRRGRTCAQLKRQSSIMFSAAFRSPGFRRRNNVRAFLMSCSEPLSAADLRAIVVG